MTPEQEAHLRRIQEEFCELVGPKYRRGRAEHRQGRSLARGYCGQGTSPQVGEVTTQVI